MTEYDGFRVAREANRGVATITLDVPEKFNRVSMGARDELAQVFGELGREQSVRVIVLCGAGDKAFTAGGDVGMFMERDADTATASASGSSSRWPATSASRATTPSSRCPS